MSYIVFSGIPGAGKSTAAAELARLIAVPLLDKDELLEALFPLHGPKDLSERRLLSSRADALLEDATRAAESAIIVSWWKHASSTADSGTPIDWLRQLRGRIVEVHCVCPPDIAVERFLLRKRHAGHFDGRWSREELLANFIAAALLGPLNVGKVITLDTSMPVDIGALWQRIEKVTHER